MPLIQNLKKELILSLTTQYSLSEANNIAHRVFEYVYGEKYPLFSELPLSQEQLQKYNEIKTRLLHGEPLQYILQKAYFFDLCLLVNKHVLIPRPETEEIVEWSIQYISNHPNIKTVLDVGTGSGCIAITLKKKLPYLKVAAWEISPDALEVAAYNAQLHNVEIDFYQQDLFSTPIEEAFLGYDCVISNPPYIPWTEKEQLPANVVHFEPHLALFVPASNPLLFYEAIAIRARNTRISVITEVHQNYADAVQKLYSNMGLKNVQVYRDMSQNARWVVALHN